MTNTNALRPSRRSFNQYIPPTFATFDMWQDGYVAAPGVEEAKDSAVLKVFELQRPFVTPRDVVLPSRDKEGFRHAERYEPLLKARTPSKATRTTTPGIKVKRRFEALSLNELRIQLALMFNPYVVDIREQYGRFDMEDYNRASAKKKRMLRSKLMTIDVISTIVCPETGRLRNHGVSIKDASYEPDDEELARELREQQSMCRAGWTWELLLGDAVSSVEYGNYGVLFSLVKDAVLPNRYEEANLFTKTLLAVSDRGCFTDVLGRVSTRLRTTPTRTGELFGTAVAYGFLTLDHRAPLRTDAPLYLIR